MRGTDPEWGISVSAVTRLETLFSSGQLHMEVDVSPEALGFNATAYTEETLDDLGIGYLADPFELRLESGQGLRVRLVEVSVLEIRAKKDDWGGHECGAVVLHAPIPHAGHTPIT